MPDETARHPFGRVCEIDELKTQGGVMGLAFSFPDKVLAHLVACPACYALVKKSLSRIPDFLDAAILKHRNEKAKRN